MGATRATTVVDIPQQLLYQHHTGATKQTYLKHMRYGNAMSKSSQATSSDDL